MILRQSSKFVYSCALITSTLLAQPADDYKWPTQPPASIPDFAKEVDNYLASLEPKGFSGVVLVADKGTILLHKAYGYADREAGRYWDANAEAWTTLSRAGYDVYHDHHVAAHYDDHAVSHHHYDIRCDHDDGCAALRERSGRRRGAVRLGRCRVETGQSLPSVRISLVR